MRGARFVFGAIGLMLAVGCRPGSCLVSLGHWIKVTSGAKRGGPRKEPPLFAPRRYPTVPRAAGRPQHLLEAQRPALQRLRSLQRRRSHACDVARAQSDAARAERKVDAWHLPGRHSGRAGRTPRANRARPDAWSMRKLSVYWKSSDIMRGQQINRVSNIGLVVLSLAALLTVLPSALRAVLTGQMPTLEPDEGTGKHRQ